MLGNTVKAKPEECDDEEFGSYTQWTLGITQVGGKPILATSGTGKSTTFLPNVCCLVGQNVVVVDFPGFFDSNASEIRLGIDLGFRMVLEHLRGRARVVAVLAAKSFDPQTEQGGVGVRQIEKIEDHLPALGSILNGAVGTVTQELSGKCIYAITGCDRKFVDDPRKLWEIALSKSQHIEKDLMISMNKHLLNQAGAMTPSEFLDKVMSTHVPQSLVSDCVANADVESLANFLNTDDFTALVCKNLTASHHRADRDKKPMSWEALLSESKERRAEIETISKSIAGLFDNLLQNQLALGALVDPDISWLLQRNQPRLTLAIAELESTVMQKVVASCTEWVRGSKEFVKDVQANFPDFEALVHSNELVKTEVDNFDKAATKAEAALKEVANDLGYVSSADLISKASVANVLVVVAGGILLVVAATTSVYWVPGMLTMGVVTFVGGLGSAVAREKMLETQKSAIQVVQDQAAIVKTAAEAAKAAARHMAALEKTKRNCKDHSRSLRTA